MLKQITRAIMALALTSALPVAAAGYAPNKLDTICTVLSDSGSKYQFPCILSINNHGIEINLHSKGAVVELSFDYRHPDGQWYLKDQKDKLWAWVPERRVIACLDEEMDIQVTWNGCLACGGRSNPERPSSRRSAGASSIR